MSMSMHSSTKLVCPSLAHAEITNSEILDGVKALTLPQSAGLRCYDGSTWVVNKTSGSSRRDCFRSSVELLCSCANITGLEFFYASPDDDCQWKFSMGEEDEDEEDIYGYTLGVLLTGEQLSRAESQLRQLLEWSAENTALLAQKDMLGYWANESDIAQSIVDGKTLAHGRNLHDYLYAEDGDGAGFLFAYLGTCEKIFANAVQANKAVLHVTEYFC